MKRIVLFLTTMLAVSSLVTEASAWPFRSRSVSVERTVIRFTGSPAQVAYAKACKMAELGMRGHLGGGMAGLHYEGTGRGVTAAAALSACCFSGTRKCAASAVAKGRNGLFYAVRLYY